jgi:hypothetical protein
MMQAELDENGILTISPTTPTEAYAIKKWAEEAMKVLDDTRIYWRQNKAAPKLIELISTCPLKGE